MNRFAQGTIIAAIVLAASFPIESLFAPEWRKWAIAGVAGLATYLVQRTTGGARRR
jgi:hypothetical protein